MLVDIVFDGLFLSDFPSGFKTVFDGLFLSGFPSCFKTRLLGEGFHTFINGGLFSSSTNVGHHNPPPSGPSVLADTLSFLQSMWDRPKSIPFGASILIGIPPRVYLLWGTTRRPTHRSVSSFDTICNSQDSSLADIFLFGLSLLGFPSSFKMR